MPPLKATVVGTGHLGRHHARIYHELPETELACVVDRDRTRGEEVASAYNSRCYTDYHECMGLVDIASIAVPTQFHYEVARDFINAGIPVLIEKPMTSTLAEAQALVRLAEEKECLVQVGHIERFNPAVVEIQKMARKPAYIEADRISPFGFRSVDIGVVLDLMIHDIDIVLHLVGAEVEEVSAVGVSVLADREDIANARLLFSNGCVANLTASRVSIKTERKIRIFQEDAYISLDYQAKKATIYRKSERLKEILPDVGAVDPRNLADVKAFVFGNLIDVRQVQMQGEEPLAGEIRAFVRAVIQKTPPAVTARDGLRAIRVAHDIQEAIKASERRLQLEGE